MNSRIKTFLLILPLSEEPKVVTFLRKGFLKSVLLTLKLEPTRILLCIEATLPLCYLFPVLDSDPSSIVLVDLLV